jgi:IS66 C-terminal element
LIEISLGGGKRVRVDANVDAAALARVLDVLEFQAWLADVLARLPDYPANKIADLLPWNWKSARLAIPA